MNITYIHPNVIPSPAANTVNVMRMCAALSEEHKVILFCRRDGNLSADEIMSNYGVRNEFQIYSIRRHPFVPDRLFYLMALISHASRRGDLVYTRSILCAYIATSLGLRTTLELHAPVGPSSPKSMRRFKSIARSKWLNKLLANSPATLSQMQSLIGRADPRFVLAPHGASEPPTEPAARTESHPYTARYVGSFASGRGIELLVEIAAITPDVRFVLTGADAAQEQHLGTILAHRGITNLKVEPRVSPSLVPLILADADVLLAPYQKRVFHTPNGGGEDSASYMSPLKLFEYMPSGVPIVASRLPAIEAFLENGTTALLCSSDDAQEWKAAILRLRSDRKYADILGRAAQKAAMSNYSWAERVRLATEVIH